MLESQLVEIYGKVKHAPAYKLEKADKSALFATIDETSVGAE